MSENPLVSELAATGASVTLATSLAERGDFAGAEQAALDARERLERVVRELGLKLQSPAIPLPTVKR